MKELFMQGQKENFAGVLKEAEAAADKITDEKEKRRAANYVKIIKKVLHATYF